MNGHIVQLPTLIMLLKDPNQRGKHVDPTNMWLRLEVRWIRLATAHKFMGHGCSHGLVAPHRLVHVLKPEPERLCLADPPIPLFRDLCGFFLKYARQNVPHTIVTKTLTKCED